MPRNPIWSALGAWNGAVKAGSEKAQHQTERDEDFSRSLAFQLAQQGHETNLQHQQQLHEKWSQRTGQAHAEALQSRSFGHEEKMQGLRTTDFQNSFKLLSEQGKAAGMADFGASVTADGGMSFNGSYRATAARTAPAPKAAAAPKATAAPAAPAADAEGPTPAPTAKAPATKAPAKAKAPAKPAVSKPAVSKPAVEQAVANAAPLLAGDPSPVEQVAKSQPVKLTPATPRKSRAKKAVADTSDGMLF